MKIFSAATTLLAFAASANAFVPGQMAPTTRNSAATTQLFAVKAKPVDEAIAIYQKRYPTKDEKTKSPFYNSWGMPKNSIRESKKIFDADNAKIRATFQELARLYGAEETLQMARDLPAILAFDKKNFKPSLVEFGKIFGEQEAKEMVMRNPGLLAIKPEDAATSDDQTMQFSYIVAKTRPFGDALLFGTLGLLSIPVIEGISGVPFRANLLQSILN